MPGRILQRNDLLTKPRVDIKYYYLGKGEQQRKRRISRYCRYMSSHYRQGHDRLFDYGSNSRAIAGFCRSAMRPQRREQRPDMPFWRLKGDGFWEFAKREFGSTSVAAVSPKRELIEYM